MVRYYHPAREEWEEQARRLAPAFLFYETWCEWDDVDFPLTEKDRILGKRAVCSSCGAIHHITTKDWRKKNIRHGSPVECPTCGRVCEAIASGKMPDRKRLAGDLRAVFCTGDRESVRLHCYYILYDFLHGANEPRLQWFEDARYELTPGAFRIWKWEAGQVLAPSGAWHIDWKFKEHKNPIEPWVSDMFGNRNGYTIFMDGLEGTFLGWLPVDEIADWTFFTTRGDWKRETVRIPWCKLITEAARTPKIEILAKRGIKEPVINLVVDKRKNARYLNWKAKRPLDFLRLPKEDAAEALAGEFSFEAVKLCREFGIRYHEAAQWAGPNHFTVEDLMEWARHTEDDPVKLARYMIGQKRTAYELHLLKDYRDAAEFLGRDLTVPSIRWPKRLWEAHDECAKSANRLREEERERTKKAASEGYTRGLYPILKKRFEYECGDYEAIVPERLEDIALEGKQMRHCVAGYIDRHAQGKLAIIFIRRVTAPMIPLWTAELTPEGTLTQIQGYHNDIDKKPRGADAAWVDGWIREVKRRIRKDGRNGQ